MAPGGFRLSLWPPVIAVRQSAGEALLMTEELRLGYSVRNGRGRRSELARSGGFGKFRHAFVYDVRMNCRMVELITEKQAPPIS